jgi:hypothetical protein
MAQRSVPAWLVDARFWVSLFVVGFWPAVLIGRFVGLAVLLVVVVGGAYVVNVLARRSQGSTARQ